MRCERYSIEVSDYCVEVYGQITIREAFDLIHYFDQQGYTHLSIGHENSTMRITKEQPQDPEEPQNLYEILLKDQEETSRQLKEKVKFQDQFIQSLINDHDCEINCLRHSNEKLEKENKINEMRSNPLVKEIFNNLTLKQNENINDDELPY